MLAARDAAAGPSASYFSYAQSPRDVAGSSGHFESTYQPNVQSGVNEVRGSGSNLGGAGHNHSHGHVQRSGSALGQEYDHRYHQQHGLMNSTDFSLAGFAPHHQTSAESMVPRTVGVTSAAVDFQAQRYGGSGIPWPSNFPPNRVPAFPQTSGYVYAGFSDPEDQDITNHHISSPDLCNGQHLQQHQPAVTQGACYGPAYFNSSSSESLAHSLPSMPPSTIRELNQAPMTTSRPLALSHRHHRGYHSAEECRDLPFESLKQDGVIFTEDRQLVGIDIVPNAEKNVFLEDNYWTCYRRNYIGVQISYKLTNVMNGRKIFINHHGQDFQVKAMAVRLSATVDRADGRSMELVQHTPKRDRGPQSTPSYQKIIPLPNSPYAATQQHSGIYGNQLTEIPDLPFQCSDPISTSLHNLQNTANYERIQFKAATANNGKRRAQQQFYHLIAELHVDIRESFEDPEKWVKIAHRPSEKMVCRGRSPGHYGNKEKETKRLRRSSKRHYAHSFATPSPSLPPDADPMVHGYLSYTGPIHTPTHGDPGVHQSYPMVADPSSSSQSSGTGSAFGTPENSSEGDPAHNIYRHGPVFPSMQPMIQPDHHEAATHDASLMTSHVGTGFASPETARITASFPGAMSLSKAEDIHDTKIYRPEYEP